MLKNILMVGVYHRLLTIVFLGLVTLGAVSGLSRLEVDTGFNSLISQNDPDVPVYDRITREFGSDNRTIVFVKDENLWTPDKLAALEELHYALEGLGFVERVDDLFNMRSIRSVGGTLDSRIFLPEAPKAQADADRAKADALYNPLLVGNIISRDGTATALLVSVRENYGDDRFDLRVNEELERILEPTRGVFQKVFQIGPPRINAELQTILFDDLRRLVPLSTLALVAAILFILRSGFAALVPLVTSGLSIVWTFGMMGWIGIPINILSAMLPSLVIVIGSTEDTHLITAYFRGLVHGGEEGRKGTSRELAVRFMMRHLSVPLLLTVLTTAMGFGSNIFSTIGLIRDFAIAATFAILANGFITIILVPLLLNMFGPLRSRIFSDDDAVAGVPGVFVNLFGFTRNHFPRLILGVTAVLCAFFLYHASKLYVTNDPLSYFQADQPLVNDTLQLQEDLAGVKVFFIVLESEQDKAFLNAKNIQKLVDIQKFLNKQGIFDRSISLADHLALVNREFNGGNPEFYRMPTKRDLVAQYLLFFHRRDLESYVSHDYHHASIMVRHSVTDSNTLNRHIHELREVVAKLAGPDMKSYVVGENLMINASAESLMVGQVKSLGILLVVIFLVMSGMFTAFKGGLVSLIPNLIPIILMFGVMGFLGIPLNPGTAMVAVIAIGIAIDGTIHLFSRYNELCRTTSDYEKAVQMTVREEATPLVATSLALALGFGVLLNSNFTLIAQFGALSAATILFALFANLLITPIIMTRIRLVGLYQILAMSMNREVLQKSPLFEGMTDYQIRKAIIISEIHEFKQGDLVLKQGTTGRSMYLILSGKVEVVRCNDTGDEKCLAVLEPGQVLGEVGYVRETRRIADARALTPVKALRFDYERLKKDLRFFPHITAKLNFNISCILGERLADVIEVLKTRPKHYDD